MIAYNFLSVLTLLPTEAGGRKKPVFSHYRPSFSFNTKQFFSGEVVFVNVAELRPGETTMAEIKLLPSRHIRHNLKSGDTFAISEGNKIVGTGVIRRIDNKEEVELSEKA